MGKSKDRGGHNEKKLAKKTLAEKRAEKQAKRALRAKEA